ncbi:hypothetical protein QFC21_001925 [Naganishia friedmannii]|uniref:Uncharacterized protein n=1 Tax=Naganishia friedmannii TaxID=89922 RepID=A0ACC2VZX2_9TREE|nr:hypothetical protein QFC21_001925 [Naganishia friedmannii]
MAMLRNMFYSRSFSTSIRSLHAAQTASTGSVAKRLPKLTLYTGGPECSLCEIMKQDLEVVRFTHAFELEMFNIREPPKDVPEEKANEIAERYKNDIPVLHLDGHYIQKHRLNSNSLKKLIEKYDPEEEDPIYAHNTFRPWTSVPGAKPKRKQALKARAKYDHALKQLDRSERKPST